MARGPVLRRRPARTPVSPIEEALAQVAAAEQTLADAKEAFKRVRHSERIAQHNKECAQDLWDDENRRRGYVPPHIERMMTLSTQRLSAAITRRLLQESVVWTAERGLQKAQQDLADLRIQSAGTATGTTDSSRFGGRLL